MNPNERKTPPIAVPITQESNLTSPTKTSRREWFRAATGGCAGLAIGGLIDIQTVQADAKKLKLAEINEFTTSCNFCACGCGMIAAVRDGKLIAMEGDYDHITNRGSLSVKGISMFATHHSPNRLKAPRYRAPGRSRGASGSTSRFCCSSFCRSRSSGGSSRASWTPGDGTRAITSASP